QYLFERRHVHAALTKGERASTVRGEVVAGIHAPELFHGHGGHAAGRTRGALQRGIVQHHHLAIRAQSDVELESIGAELQSARKGLQRVLRSLAARAPVTDDQRTLGTQQPVCRSVAPHADPTAPGSVRSSTSPSHWESMNASTSANGIAAAIATGQRQAPSEASVNHATPAATAPGSRTSTSSMIRVANSVRYNCPIASSPPGRSGPR